MMDRRGSLTDSFIGKIIILIASTILILALIAFIWNRVLSSDEDKIVRCAASLKMGRSVEDAGGFTKYFFNVGDICQTIEKKLPRDEGSKKAIEHDIMMLIANSWRETLEGSEDVFKHQLFADKTCFITYVFEIKETDGFKKGDIIRRSDFKADLGTTKYKTLEVDGQSVEYTFLDYVQEYGYPGRIEVLPQAKDFCKDDRGNKLTDDECTKRGENVGFLPKGVYAIAVVSPQGVIDMDKLNIFSDAIVNKINYVIIGEDYRVRGMCHVK